MKNKIGILENYSIYIIFPIIVNSFINILLFCYYNKCTFFTQGAEFPRSETRLISLGEERGQTGRDAAETHQRRKSFFFFFCCQLYLSYSILKTILLRAPSSRKRTQKVKRTFCIFAKACK